MSKQSSANEFELSTEPSGLSAYLGHNARVAAAERAYQQATWANASAALDALHRVRDEVAMQMTGVRS